MKRGFEDVIPQVMEGRNFDFFLPGISDFPFVFFAIGRSSIALHRVNQIQSLMNGNVRSCVCSLDSARKGVFFWRTDGCISFIGEDESMNKDVAWLHW